MADTNKKERRFLKRKEIRNKKTQLGKRTAKKKEKGSAEACGSTCGRAKEDVVESYADLGGGDAVVGVVGEQVDADGPALAQFGGRQEADAAEQLQVAALHRGAAVRRQETVQQVHRQRKHLLLAVLLLRHLTNGFHHHDSMRIFRPPSYNYLSASSLNVFVELPEPLLECIVSFVINKLGHQIKSAPKRPTRQSRGDDNKNGRRLTGRDRKTPKTGRFNGRCRSR